MAPFPFLLSLALLLVVPLPSERYGCPVYTPGTMDVVSQQFECPLLSPALNISAECETFTVPLDYSQKSSAGNISIFVKTVLAPKQPAQGEIWLLMGGPGCGGAWMECMIEPLITLTGGRLNLVIPDHRGTARSTQMNCGDSTQTTASCLRGAMSLFDRHYLQSFTTANAARDIHFVLQHSKATRTASLPKAGYSRMMYGVSYGTYWANQFMVLYPDAMDAVVLDGVAAPDLARFFYQDYGTSTAGTALFVACGRDPVCSGQLGVDAIYSLELFYELLRAGQLQTCANRVRVPAAEMGVASFQGTFNVLLNDRNKRLLIPALIRRFLRCEPRDVLALRHFFHISLQPGGTHHDLRCSEGCRPSPSRAGRPTADAAGGVGGGPTVSQLLVNPILYFNVAYSEMSKLRYSDPSLSVDEAVYMEKLLDFGGNMNRTFMKLAAAVEWPTYRAEPAVYNRYPATNSSVLLLGGTMDPQTPHSWLMRASHFFNKPNQFVVTVPNAPHATAWGGRSPVQGREHYDCGMQITASFFNSRGAAVETGCLQDLLPMDFAGDTAAMQELSNQTFGTPNLWH